MKTKIPFFLNFSRAKWDEVSKQLTKQYLKERNLKEFYLEKYGNEWAIYARTCECPIIFGPKRRLMKRLEELNKGN